MKKGDKLITIAFPSRGSCNPAFAHALKLMAIPRDFNTYEVLYIAGADCAVSRNKLASAARGEYIFFVDDDVLPPPNAIVKLYEHKKDFITGLYFARQRPHYPQIHTLTKDDERRCDSVIDYPKDKLIEVDACAAGCMLIKRKVFEKLKQPYFHYIPATETEPKMGEDFFFCKKLREAGIKIYCDTSVICRHIGDEFIGPQHWDIYRQRLAQMEDMMGPEKFKEYKKQLQKLQEVRQNDVNK